MSDARDDDNLFSLEAIALQARPPALRVRMVSLALCAMAALAVGYACVVSTDVVVTAQGRVIPSGRSKVLQSPQAGVVRRIAVRDGQAVRAGEVLLELDATTTGADRDRLQRELWEAQADAARLTALLEGRARLALREAVPGEIEVHQQALLLSRRSEQLARVATLQADLARRAAERDTLATALARSQEALPLVHRKQQMREELARTGYIADAGLIEVRLEAMQADKEAALNANRLQEAQAGLEAARAQLQQAQAEFHARTAAELQEAVRRRDAARQELIKAQQRQEWQVLRSPIDGVVQQMAVSTEGGVVTPAQLLLTVVPAQAELEVEAQVLNRDIGHLRVGQRVVNKVESFDFTRYGAIEGQVRWVGTDAVLDPHLGPVYPVRITVSATRMPQGAGAIMPGMNVAAEIRTGERRLISYFMSPLLRTTHEALRER